MPYEDILQSYNSQKKISENVPSARSTFELEGLSQNKAFLKHQRDGAEYMARRNEQLGISNQSLKDRLKKSELSRFEANYLVPETSPEAKELNEDFHDMMYSPEGQQWLADHAIGATLGGDLSLSYPESTDEAFNMALKNPSVCEQMMIVAQITDKNQPYKMNKLVAEQLQYNKVAIQYGAIGKAMTEYYGSDLCCAFKTNTTNADMVPLMQNVEKAKLPTEENERLMSVFGQMAAFNDGNTAAKKNTVRQLKEEGVIGPESMFYRCYDENNQRIAFDKAVNARAAGKKVEFRKMSEAEQAEMREALKNPTTLVKKDPGAIRGKGFQEECRRLYEALDGVDSMFIRSSEQFRTIKKSLKEMAGRKTIPNDEEAKKFLHDIVKVTSSYIKDKEKVKDKSDYANNRLDAMKRVHESLSAKLGALAFNSYKVKTATRERYEQNQADMAQALDIENVEKDADKFLSEEEIKQPADNAVTENKQLDDDSMSIGDSEPSDDDLHWLMEDQPDDDGISVDDDEQPAVEGLTDKENGQPEVEDLTEKENEPFGSEVEVDKEKIEALFADVDEPIVGNGGTQLDQMADFVEGKIEPTEKIIEDQDAPKIETVAEDVAGVVDEIGKSTHEYAFEENPDVTLNFGGNKDELFLQELTDRKLFDRKVDKLDLHGKRETNVKFLYEKAAKARKTLEDKCASGQEKVDAHEMKDIVAYGVVMHGLENDADDWCSIFIASKDITKQDPGILVAGNLKKYFDKEHSVDVVKTMLNNAESLEGTCSYARSEMNKRLHYIRENNLPGSENPAHALDQAGKALNEQSKALEQQAKVNEQNRKNMLGLK